jgi:hypothetical protein
VSPTVSVVTVVEKSPTDQGIPLPSGDLMQVMHDYRADDGLIRIGMPSVLSMYLNQYTQLTEAWQWFWFRHLLHAYTDYAHWDSARLSPAELDMLKARWRSLTKHSEAFTNFKGTDLFHDYISPNKLPGLPGQEPLTCTGNIHKVLGDKIRFAGEMYTPIETLDGTQPPPSITLINRLTRPDLIPCATNVAADKSNRTAWTVVSLADGTWRVDPFPQLSPKPTPFVLRTNGKEADDLKARLRDKDIPAPAGTYIRDGIHYAVNYIRSNRLQSFAGTVVPNPYNPPQ